MPDGDSPAHPTHGARMTTPFAIGETTPAPGGSFAAALFALALLPGCATFRSYDAQMHQALALTGAGQVDRAVQVLQSGRRRSDTALLYYLELGELERLQASYRASQNAWAVADQQVQRWEAGVDAAAAAGFAASWVINDKVRPYEGHDYEKVLLTTRMAMNFLARGDLAKARVAIKQTHEREAVIAALRARQYRAIEEQARQRGGSASVRELNGYPVEEIDNPAVNALRNSYQNALSHTLAAFVYEALGEPSLAAAGYRQALELRPGLPMLEESLAGLDARISAPDDGLTDTLILVETGFAPARVSRRFTLPIPIDDELVLFPLSVPIMESMGVPEVPAEVRLADGPALTPAEIANIDLMARRALKDEMPGILLRSVVRATTRAAAQVQMRRAAKEARSQGDDSKAGWLDAGATIVALGSVATESADERAWRSLPAQVYIARGRLPRGARTLTVVGAGGEHRLTVDVSGRHAFIALRLLRGNLYAMLPEAPLPGGRQQTHTAFIHRQEVIP